MVMIIILWNVNFFKDYVSIIFKNVNNYGNNECLILINW